MTTPPRTYSISMMGSSQPVAGVGIGDRQGETAATDHDQEGVKHSSAPIRTGFHAIPSAPRLNVTASATAKWMPSTRPISKSTAPGRGNPDVARESAGYDLCVWGAATSRVREEEWGDPFIMPGKMDLDPIGIRRRIGARDI